MYDFVSYNEIGNLLGKHTRHGVNSSLGFVEPVIFISHFNMVIMSNRVNMQQPNRSIAYNTLKGALLFRITKFHVQNSVPLKQFIVTLLFTAFFRLNY